MSEATVTLTLTLAQLEALGFALDLAFDDQEHYLDYSNPQADYGDEWEDVKRSKAESFRHIAEFAYTHFPGEFERWNALADSILDIDTDACDCEKRSWYGQDHDSACPVTIQRAEAMRKEPHAETK